MAENLTGIVSYNLNIYIFYILNMQWSMHLKIKETVIIKDFYYFLTHLDLTSFLFD